MKFKTRIVAAAALAASLTGFSHAATELVIATVNNGHMIEMAKLGKNFEQANPDIKLKWVTLEEGVLRQRVTTDIATKGGQFDVMTIGMYETPIWGKKGWLKELKGDAAYDADDILPASLGAALPSTTLAPAAAVEERGPAPATGSGWSPGEASAHAISAEVCAMMEGEEEAGRRC